MDRTKAAGHQNNMFVEADPATNRAPSEVSAVWLNTIQEELANLAMAMGAALDPNNNAQVTLAVKNLIKQAGLQYAGYTDLTASRSLTAADIGCMIMNGGNNTLTLPTPNSLGAPAGASVTLTNYSGTLTVAMGAGVTYAYGAAGLTANLSVLSGESLTFVAQPSGTAWAVVSGNASIRNIPSISSLMPAGAVLHFAMSAVPNGWFVADGSTISRTSYAALFAAIGTLFGAGNGSSTFSLPDLRGEFLRGFDSSRGVDSGRAFGVLQKGTRHFFTARDSGYVGTGWTDKLSVFDGREEQVVENLTGYPKGNLALESGSGDARVITFAARPRNMALLACIKY